MNIVEIALSYAKEKHKGQKYGEEDYFEGHICKVYEIIKQVGGSETEQVVAILQMYLKIVKLMKMMLSMCSEKKSTNPVWLLHAERERDMVII